MRITVLTPTYNRGGSIQKLYTSLDNQSIKDFEWLIVDDGSLDDTAQVVRKVQKSADFRIRYIYKENGGKHTALNEGIKNIESDLTFIVDSDDWLKPNAIETVLRYYGKFWDRNGLCGYSFLRVFPDGKINGKEFEPNEWVASYIEARINSDDTMADKAEVFYTHCLKEFPFPEYSGEKFLGEDIVWIRMARKYNMIHINEAIYVGDYQSDGLTKNKRANNIKSPVGCMHRAEEFMKKDINHKYRIKGGLQYIIYGLCADYTITELLRNSKNKLLTFVCIVPGKVLKARWSRKL